VVPVVEALKGIGAIVSVDTWNARVVTEAAAAGLDLVNDAEGFQAPAMIEAVAASGLPVVVPFINAATPQQLDGADLGDPIAAMVDWFADAVARLEAAGVDGAILDPGTSFSRQGMTAQEKDAFQRTVFARLGELRRFGRPLLAPLPKRDARSEVAAFADLLVAAGTDFVRTHAPRFVTAAKAAAQRD
jgi:dihydropteroate synthase